MKSPKILIVDIETSPYEGKVWGKYDQTILAFTKYREILSVAYKWHGKEAIHCATRKGEKSDYRIAKFLGALLSKADITVAHNGRRFDVRVARTQMIKHGVAPLRPIVIVDPCETARSTFSFPSNKLDDIAQFLGVGRKIAIGGIENWPDPIKGPRKVWANMVRYNKHDVFLLDGVYSKMRPWMENHPNVARILKPLSRKLGICPNCVSKNVEKRGYRATSATVRQQWNCQDCGKWFLTRKEAT